MLKEVNRFLEQCFNLTNTRQDSSSGSLGLFRDFQVHERVADGIFQVMSVRMISGQRVDGCDQLTAAMFKLSQATHHDSFGGTRDVVMDGVGLELVDTEDAWYRYSTSTVLPPGSGSWSCDRACVRAFSHEDSNF